MERHALSDLARHGDEHLFAASHRALFLQVREKRSASVEVQQREVHHGPRGAVAGPDGGDPEIRVDVVAGVEARGVCRWPRVPWHGLEVPVSVQALAPGLEILVKIEQKRDVGARVGVGRALELRFDVDELFDELDVPVGGRFVGCFAGLRPGGPVVIGVGYCFAEVVECDALSWVSGRGEIVEMCY